MGPVESPAALRMLFDRSTAARAFAMAGLLTENIEEVEDGGGGGSGCNS